MDFDALRRAMAENHEQPEGPARNARAEHLLSEAEKLDIPLAVIEALGHQLKVYNYSSEKDKMFVPFARLLRMWDERPEDFDEYETHSLHWVFKWMSSGMLGQPHIPLASIEKWLGEMEHRYRLAGHSERAVRSAEFSVAAHVGDLARAERAYAAWLAADRDSMADCHACELHGQGWWRALRHEDAQALELWRPVLEGEHACAHEPHTTLASSLVPLLRLGRLDEARVHHLRGFRLVRHMESMRGAYADHVEFCALTGNEARALELLAERPAYFTDSGEPRSLMDFLAVVALLMGRLTSLGLGSQTVPGPVGRTWTAGELAAHARGEALLLAARFDERNGTSYVSGQVRERMEGQPLAERLPLGVRAARTVVAARPPAPATRAPVGEPDLATLLAEARRLSEALHPDSVAAWAAVARAAGEEEGELDVRDRAEIADHEAMGLGPDGVELFERAAELYAEAGDPGEALAARARGAYVLGLTGRSDEALAAVAEPYERVGALFSEGRTGVWQTASVCVGRARILLQRVHEVDDGEDAEGAGVEGAADALPGEGPGTRAREAFAAAEAAARELLDLAGPHTADVRLASRAAEAQAMLGELAAHAGDAEAAAELLTRATEAFVAAGLPWFAVEYEARLTGIARHLGDAEGAERAARAALEHGGPYLEAPGRAQLHLQLAEVLGSTGQFGPAAEQALEAAHWADEAGEGATLGAWARHQLGGFLVRRGRWAEAAEVLESALPELTVPMHGDGAIVQTLWWLGDCLAELGEHREAAERRLQAAEIARHWPEQRDHAMLAHLAAEALGHAGLPAEAERAYERAGDLWRSLGNVHGLVRSLRARAWIAVSEEGAGLDAARQLMATAALECDTALPEAEDDDGRLQLAAELAHTHRQFGDLIARQTTDDTDGDSMRAGYEEALAHVTRAVTGFASLGDAGLHSRTGAELAAGWLEADLGRTDAAAARARGVLAAYAETDDDPNGTDGTDETDGTDGTDGTAVSRRAEAQSLLRVTAAEG
ncbi:tetratricopeptide repeat protein [Streptomyces sporangiiformans]|uniref:Tetratricopeptide repeat protein n=2 Tax=Streptomyces sporangiiformans TaxID=2315329 RepID=A0A505DNQ2_9ACTN|nr:tetratricopeptide repeat protein [Streptomyces sporangiiformans]